VISLPYGDGKLLDLYRSPTEMGCPCPVVLFWHGSGPNERDALAALASAVAEKGAVCLVPDWRSDDAVAGREDLLASLSFSQRRAAEFGGDSERIALCGWSLGANAAADVMLNPLLMEGWRPRAFVGLASGYHAAPITGIPLAEGMATDAGVPCLLIHGVRDHIAPVQRSREFHRALQDRGWTSNLKEVDADHAGVIGTRYDPVRRRCVPSDNPARVRVLGSVAEWLFTHVDSA
jgi:dienelactone hydrolase